MINKIFIAELAGFYRNGHVFPSDSMVLLCEAIPFCKKKWDIGIEHPLRTFANDTKLRGVTDTLEGCAAIQ